MTFSVKRKILNLENFWPANQGAFFYRTWLVALLQRVLLPYVKYEARMTKYFRVKKGAFFKLYRLPRYLISEIFF